MIEIRSLRDLLRLLFIYQREFKLAALSAVVIIVLGAFLLPAKYESNARLLVKPGRDSTLPIEISNRQALVMPSTQRDPIVDEERLLTGTYRSSARWPSATSRCWPTDRRRRACGSAPSSM